MWVRIPPGQQNKVAIQQYVNKSIVRRKHSSMVERSPVKRRMNVRLILFPLEKGGVMFFRLFKKFKNVIGLFNGYFIDVKVLYMVEFDAVCCVSFVGEIDTTKAFAFISETLKTGIVIVYQHSYYDHNQKQMFFNNTIFVLANKIII